MNIIYNYCIVCGEEFPHNEDLWTQPWWKDDDRTCCDEVVCYECFLHNTGYLTVICPVCKELWWLNGPSFFNDF